MHVWGYWYCFLKSWFQLVLHPACHFSCCILQIRWSSVWLVFNFFLSFFHSLFLFCYCCLLFIEKKTVSTFENQLIHITILKVNKNQNKSWKLNPPVSSVHGILQVSILKWVAISFSRDHPKPWITPRCPALQADSLSFEPPWKLGKLEQP